MIKAEIVAHSLSPQGDELISVLGTFPRIILAEVNTHKMLSKNTSSSRAIPFNKMVEAVQNNPFIPIAWQKEHKGMQGSGYFDKKDIATIVDGHYTNSLREIERNWLKSRDEAIKQAKRLNKLGVTKQLCNRLLEPFMWTTMLITGSKEGWNNFFELRCPQYQFKEGEPFFKSWEDLVNHYGNQTRDFWSELSLSEYTILDRLKLNRGQEEIHMMAFAEAVWDAYNESTPKELKEGEWHIPFEEQILKNKEGLKQLVLNDWLQDENKVLAHAARMEYVRMEDVYGLGKIVKISTAMAERTSYTVVGEEKEINYEDLLRLHDRLIAQNPPHSSPMEHCARAMSDEEYFTFRKGDISLTKAPIGTSFYLDNDYTSGWCRNFKGFIQYRHLIEEKNYDSKNRIRS